MIIYAVLWRLEYEGDSLCGVYTTEDKAKTFARRRGRVLVSGYMAIETWELDDSHSRVNGIEVYGTG